MTARARPGDLPAPVGVRAVVDVDDETATYARAMTARQMFLVVALAGALVTASATWGAVSLDRRNERGLLQVQTRQAAAVLGASILGVSDPLRTVLEVEAATGGSSQQFQRATAAIVGPGRLFASASLWTISGSVAAPISTVGSRGPLPPGSSQERDLVNLALSSGTFVVSSVSVGARELIAYAMAGSGSPRLVVYAERPIPANRQVPVESSSAFADLHFATYLGSVERASALATTDVPADQLPLSGDTAREVIPFGNSSLLLVTSASRPLGGSLGQQLPWMFLLGGALMTTAAATTGYQLVRRRRSAEGDARTISALYGELRTLYGEQRTIAEALQKALLPAFNPSIPELDIASRYIAGAHGVDIGGDWFSIVRTDEHHFAFVIGDVSGRGVSAASIMARLRFTVRAYLLEGHPPQLALGMCSRQLDVGQDGHFATVIVGIGDLRSREIVLANAGHLAPLLITQGQPQYLATEVGLPVGITEATYVPTRTVMPTGSSLLLFTDGLVERRGENIDVGLDRLKQVATAPVATVDDLLTRLVTELTDDDYEDDIALLAFTWR